MLEEVEARCGQTPDKSIILCTRYQNEGWYDRGYAHPSDKSPISEVIMDRIFHNAYYIDIKEKISMHVALSPKSTPITQHHKSESLVPVGGKIKTQNSRCMF